MKFTFGRKAFQSILLTGIAAGIISFLFLGLLDRLVHKDLYSYGLQFSYEWANRYWTYMRLAVVCVGVFVAANCAALFYLYRTRTRYYQIETRTKPKPKLGLTRIVSLTLFCAGVVALTVSILFSSSILAFIGLGLTFWGAILLYIRTEKYIEALLGKTTLPSLATLNQIIEELGFKGQAVYLPPKYLRDFESSKVFIAKQERTKLPTPKQIQKQEERMFLKDPEGILLTPPGADLTRLFEKTLDTSFTKVDLQYLEMDMPRLLVEDLEIAENVEIEAKKNMVYAKIVNSIYKNMQLEAERLPKVGFSLSCPICSAIACAIAKASGRPVVIESDQTSEDGQTLTIEYRLL
jgi:uncharacterized membrane protein YiaA